MNSISCIIPIYGLTTGNNQRYFENLLLSLSKSLECLIGNYDIIIINDDRTRISSSLVFSLCEKYNLRDSVRYFENMDNKGQAYSRNIGASYANSEYLYFIDQDDYISLNFFNSFCNSTENSDLYIAKPYFNIGDLKIVKAYTFVLFLFYYFHRKLSSLWPLLASNLAYSPGQVLIKNSCFKEAGGFPVLANKGSDDFGLFFNMIFTMNLNYSFMSHSKFIYRVHPQQNSKHCDMTASVKEFLDSVNSNSIKTKIINLIKLNRHLHWLNKLIYIILFKRVR